MGRSIQLRRDELVWQTRCNSWDENDFKRHMEWLATYKDVELKQGEDSSYENLWAYHHRQEYEFLSQYTWDQICGWVNGEDDEHEPKLEYQKNSSDYGWTTYISELIKDAMREENYDCDVSDENYADDSYEEWDVTPAPEASDNE